jgi:hypothetical protein
VVRVRIRVRVRVRVRVWIRYRVRVTSAPRAEVISKKTHFSLHFTFFNTQDTLPFSLLKQDMRDKD